MQDRATDEQERKMRESYPLQWPEGWPRTALKDREERPVWKKSESQALEILAVELKRFGVLSAQVTRKDPHDIRTAADPSVAVLFSRKRDDDFSWQGALRISNPAPSLEEIETAFRKLASQFHPDKPGGDDETFIALSKHKKNAIAYVNRLSGSAHDYVIACDKFRQANWNITAISHTIRSLRQMERDGTSRLLERALTGFAALPEGNHVEHAATA
jgi:hypothetical protein